MLTGLQAAWSWEVYTVIFTFSSLYLLLRFYWVKTAADCLRNLIYEYRLYVNIITSLEKLYLIEFTKMTFFFFKKGCCFS